MEQENFKISGRQELKEEEVKTVEKVKDMVSYLYNLKGKMMEVNERIGEIAEELEKKYPDLRRTYLFHVMLLSSDAEGMQYTSFDLPGEDSIVKRLEALVKEYETK